MLNRKIEKKLYKYQIQDTNNILQILKKNNVVASLSDTGTGKTYTAIAACSALKLSPIVICPKSVISVWKKVCNYFDVKPFFIVNYETIKFCKYYDKDDNRIECPYIIHIEEKKKDYYEWKLKSYGKYIFIFDEVHKCSNYNTLNGKLLISAKKANFPMIILSATLADIPEKIKIFSYILNFLDKKIVFEKCYKFSKYMDFIEKWLEKSKNPIKLIHNMLIPDRATRMRIDMIPDFPETQISAVSYNIDKKDEIEIQNQYEIIDNSLRELQNKKNKDKANILVAILRARQKIELLKISIILDLVNNYKEEKKSIVIFVNFKQTLDSISKLLETECVIHGEQTAKEREKNINMFQENIANIIICNIQSGGVGISLHDIHGTHPRVSIVCPTWNAIDLKQSLGRIHRAGSKTKSIQRIIYVANTVEERVADKLDKKLKNLNSINNGDLMVDNIDFD